MRLNKVSPPKEWPSPGTHNRFIEIDLEALTPIYKGGSTTEQIDEGRPFRAPSIRGALRYWWRATSAISNINELYKQEKALFGGVHGEDPIASAVSVAVLTQQSTPGRQPANKSYAFGLMADETKGAAQNRLAHHSATGKLRVEWRDTNAGKEIQRALKAWLLFGGIGGRSRRGAGSVWWKEGLDRPETVEDYIAAWQSLIPRRTSAPWPSLKGSVMLVGPSKPSADAAWKEGLDGMRDVRASRQADVRPNFVHVRGSDLLVWKRQDYIPIARRQNFTSKRAALGLPIPFRGQGVMQPTGYNRYPSPLHLKVIRLGRQFHPVTLAVRGPAPNKLRAKNAEGILDATGLDYFLDLAAKLPGWTRYS